MTTGNDSRKLTATEIAGLPAGLVKAVDIAGVELVGRHSWVSRLAMLIGRGAQIVVRGRRVFWPRLQADFSDDAVAMSLLAHELVHVWQYANGMTLWAYILRERGVYRYQLDGRSYGAYGYEQQAAMVEDWVRLHNGLAARWGHGVDRKSLEAIVPFHD